MAGESNQNFATPEKNETTHKRTKLDATNCQQRREASEPAENRSHPSHLPVGDCNANLILSELIKFNDQLKRLTDSSSNLNESFLKSLTPSLDKYNGDQQLLNLLKFKIMNVLVEFDREHPGRSSDSR